MATALLILGAAFLLVALLLWNENRVFRKIPIATCVRCGKQYRRTGGGDMVCFQCLSPAVCELLKQGRA